MPPPLPPCKSMQKKHVWLQECSSSIQHMHTTTFFRLRLFWCSDLQTPQSAQLGIRQRAADCRHIESAKRPTLKQMQNWHWHTKKQLHSRVITRCNQHSCIVFTCVYYVLVSYNKSDTSGCRCVLMAGRVEQKTKAWCLGNDSKLTSSTSSTSSTVSPCPQFLPQILRQDSAHLSSMQSSPIHFPQLSISCVYSVMIVMLRSWHSWHSSHSSLSLSLSQRLQCQANGHENHETQMIHSANHWEPYKAALLEHGTWCNLMQHDATWYELIWCTMWYDICAKQKGSRFCSESVDVSRVIWKTRQSIQKGDKMGVAHCRKAFDVSLHGKLPKSWRWGLATQNRCIEW